MLFIVLVIRALELLHFCRLFITIVHHLRARSSLRLHIVLVVGDQVWVLDQVSRPFGRLELLVYQTSIRRRQLRSDQLALLLIDHLINLLHSLLKAKCRQILVADVLSAFLAHRTDPLMRILQLCQSIAGTTVLLLSQFYRLSRYHVVSGRPLGVDLRELTDPFCVHHRSHARWAEHIDFDRRGQLLQTRLILRLHYRDWARVCLIWCLPHAVVILIDVFHQPCHRQRCG